MKRKIIGIFVCMLLIATVLPVTGNFDTVGNTSVDQQFKTYSRWTISYEHLEEIDDSNIDRHSNVQSNSIDVEITRPKKSLYINDNNFFGPGSDPFDGIISYAIIIGQITIEAEVTDSSVEKVEFYVDDVLKMTDYTEPFSLLWDETSFGSHTIEVKAYEDAFDSVPEDTDRIEVKCFNLRGSPTPEITRNEAIDILVNEVIKPNELDHIVYAFTLDEPLQEGDQTSPWLPHPTPKSVQKAPYPEYRTTTENEWFFWIDDSPRARFSHKTRYVYIDAVTAKMDVIEERWWPILNDKAIWCADEDYWNPDNWAYTNDNSPTEKSNEPEDEYSDTIKYALSKRAMMNKDTLSSGCSCSFNGENGECAIVINGNNGSENGADGMKTDADAMGLFWGTYPGFTTQELNPESNNNSQSDIEDAFDNTSDCDDCVVYVVAHGGVAADGEPYVSCNGENVWESEFDDMVSENPDTEYKFVFDCCHSGSFIESLSKQNNTRKIITASDKCQTAWGDIDDEDFVDPPPEHPDPNGDTDEGGEFSSGFAEDLWEEWLKNPNIDIVKLLDKAYESACAKDVCALNGITDPQVWERVEEDTENPKVTITGPEDGENVDSPINVIGYATDYGGSGIAELDYKLEWDGGSYEGGSIYFDPPLGNTGFKLGPINLGGYIEPGDWISITIYAIDDFDNIGSDKVTVTWVEEEEDTIPPVTIKEVGQPNEEDGFIIWPNTPITLIATDEGGSGVQAIYLEVWHEGVIRDTDWYKVTMVEFTPSDFQIYWGLMELYWYAIDNAENVEDMHYQKHIVMEG